MGKIGEIGKRMHTFQTHSAYILFLPDFLKFLKECDVRYVYPIEEGSFSKSFAWERYAFFNGNILSKDLFTLDIENVFRSKLSLFSHS